MGCSGLNSVLLASCQPMTLRETHNGQLHSQAKTQIGNPLFPGKPDRLNFTFYTPVAKAAGHQDTVNIPRNSSR